MSNPPTIPPVPPGQPESPPPGPTVNIGEEYGTAKKNLPPARIVVPAVVVVLVIVLVTAFLKHARPQASGSLDTITAVDIQGQNSTMVALTFTLRNTSDKPMVVRTLQGLVKAPWGQGTADAVPAVDFDRYFQAFPTLKNGAATPLPPETRIQPGETTVRTIIVAFPKPLDEFNQHESVAVVIWPYDQTVPVVLSK